ncbi:MAG: glycosyltransferase family 4 protein [Sedimentisphaerales bacterium]
MRILIITQYFQPEPFIKGLSFAKELVKRGHEVQVLTGFPNHPYGKIYPGYRIRFLQREQMEGISVVRVPLYPSHDRSSLKRFLNYTSFGVSASTIGFFATKKADVAYVYHPPPTSCLPAIVMKVLKRIPFVYDIQDLWPDSLPQSGMFNSKFGIWAAGKCCNFLYYMARKIVVLSPGFKKVLCARGIPEDKIEVIYNWCDDTSIRSVERDTNLAVELGMNDRFNVMFAGNMGTVQILDTVIDAADIVRHKLPDVQFVFVGDGSESDYIKQKTKDIGLKNVLFIGRQPVSKMGSILSLADVLLVQLKDHPLFRITIPSKIQAYLSAGKPILTAIEGDAADLVLKANAGLKCEPGNPQSIAEAVEKFRSMPRAQLNAMGENGRKFYQQELSLKIGTERFEAVFESIIKK